jgi:sugar phosphate isomerase/epimerase
VYAVLEAIDTKVVRFGPDVGQLAKGGSDPVKVVKDFLPLIRHVHLKDWNGGLHWAEYCPLGQGKVPVPTVLDLIRTTAIRYIPGGIRTGTLRGSALRSVPWRCIVSTR